MTFFQLSLSIYICVCVCVSITGISLKSGTVILLKKLKPHGVLSKPNQMIYPDVIKRSLIEGL